MRTATLGLILFGASTAAVAAAPATPEEAQRLAGVFATYLPTLPPGKPAVAVVPHGEGYLVTLDIGRALTPLNDAGLSVTAGDLAATLTPQPDGRWLVHVDGLPPVGVVRDGQATSWTFDGYRLDGTFDPALQAFATSATENRGWTSHLTSGTGEGVDAKLVGAAQGTSTAVSAGLGAASLAGKSETAALSYSFTVATPGPGSGSRGGEATAKAASQASAFKWDHVPTVALADLWRFLMAHPSRPALTAAQAELKDRLRAVVPLAGALDGSLALEKLVVDTTLGTFAVDTLRERYGSAPGPSGTTPSLSFAFAGLSLPAGLAPPAAAPLVPTGLDLTVSFGPLDLWTPLRAAIDAMDLAKVPPIGVVQARALLADVGADAAALTIGPSTLSLPTMTVHVQGVARFTKPLPAGSVTASAVGLDKTIEAIRAAAHGDPMGNQAITLLLAAKGLARAEGPDSYSWLIESEPAGTVRVNGTALGDIAAPGQRP